MSDDKAFKITDDLLTSFASCAKPNGMTLEQDLDLKGLSSKLAVDAFREMKYDIVTLSLGVNAWACGFYAGVRFHFVHGDRDFRRWWERLYVKPFTVNDHARAMARQYVERFPSLSPENIALVLSAAETGFEKGCEHARLTKVLGYAKC